MSRAAVLLLVSAILDNLDGRVARLTGTTTEFGVQFDSLADIISFGVAPAFLAHQWGMTTLGRAGWVVSFLFVICGAMRLARFNIQPLSDKRFFVGLPIPAAALILGSLVFYRPQPVTDPLLGLAVLLLVLTLAGLMVSRLRYPSLKQVDAGGRRSFLVVALIALLLGGIALDPQVAFMALAVIYLLSGLVPRRSLAAERRAAAVAGRRGLAVVGSPPPEGADRGRE
jgi:CDP-diacylglycerol--serine O-phosphatidyltransferase